MKSGVYNFYQFVQDLQDSTGHQNLSNRYAEIRRLMFRGEREINPFGSVFVRKKMKLYVGNGNFDGTKLRLEEDFVYLDKVGCCDEGLCEGSYYITPTNSHLVLCDGETRTEITYVYWAVRCDENGWPYTTYNHSEALIKWVILQWKRQAYFMGKIGLREVQALEIDFEDHAAFARGEDMFPTEEQFTKMAMTNQTQMMVLWTEFDRDGDGCIECSCLEDFSEMDPNDDTVVPPTNTAPTVDDNSAPLQVEDYQFMYESFTNNYFDAENHLPGTLVIRSLPDPTLGTIYRINPLTAELVEYPGIGSELDINFSNQLYFDLNDELYIDTDGSLIRFDGEDIYARIEKLLSDGYTQRPVDNCSIDFVKQIPSDIPNDTDLFFFLDTTDIPIDDAETLVDLIGKWYIIYTAANDSFTGDYYILPTVDETWLQNGGMPRTGFFTGYTEDFIPPSLSASDVVTAARWQALCKTPEGINTRNWQLRNNAMVFSFIDESANDYHSPKRTDGFDNTVGQPTNDYVNDYLNFTAIHPQYNFFKGIVIPVIVDVDTETGAFCLHAAAAIEGTQLTSGEIAAIGCPADIGLLETENPYEAFPISGFPDMVGLKDFGWEYNLTFGGTHDTVYTDVNMYPVFDAMLDGAGATGTDTVTLVGTCLPNDSICFQFAVKEQSDDELQSNDATFCFNVQLVDVETKIWAFQLDDIGTPGQDHTVVTQAWIAANGTEISEAAILAGNPTAFTGIGRIGFAVQTGTQDRYDIYQFGLDVSDKFTRVFNLPEQLDVYISDEPYSPGTQLIQFKTKV